MYIIYISIYIYMFISIYLSIYLSIYRSIDLSIYLSIYLSSVYLYIHMYIYIYIYAHIFVILVLEICFFYWDNWDWCLKSSLWCFFFEWWMISIQQKYFWVCFSSENRWKLGFGTKESGHVSNVSGLYFQVFWHSFWVSFPLGWEMIQRRTSWDGSGVTAWPMGTSGQSPGYTLATNFKF